MDGLKSFVEDYNKLVLSLNEKLQEDANYRKYAPLTDAVDLIGNGIVLVCAVAGDAGQLNQRAGRAGAGRGRQLPEVRPPHLRAEEGDV